MTVREIVTEVRRDGDAAVRRWALELDGVEPHRARATEAIPEEALLALAGNVRRWHEAQVPRDVEVEIAPGVHLQRRWFPIDPIGVYVPRGLLSTLVMCVVPAQVAGVERIVIATPPSGAGAIAAAARLLGVRDVWALGGPPAIAAFAYGTESLPRVAKIVGPGNTYVNEAKLIVASDVAIDVPAGPSELTVVASRDADERVIELELSAQREHGPDTVTNLIRIGDDPESALDQIRDLAPEHVLLLGTGAEALADRIRNAGAVFVGAASSVAFGDYATGANHVLPTGGWARSVGGLGVEAFLKPVTFQHVDEGAVAHLRSIAQPLADAEGMHAHAAAVAR